MNNLPIRLKKNKGQKNQHYVARYNLTAWADKGHIAEFDKVGKKINRKQGLKKAACELYFYELKGINTPELLEKRKCIEELLAAVESICAPVLQQLWQSNDYETFLSTGDNYDRLMIYASYQLLRSPAMRLAVGDVRSPLGKQTAENWLEKMQINGTVNELNNAEKEEFFDENWKKIQHFTVMAKGFNQIRAVFGNLEWELLLIPPSVTNNFVISDTGLGHKDEGIFVFPLSPRLVLLLSKKKPADRFRHCSESEVIDLNECILAGAVRRIYCKVSDLDSIVHTANLHPEWCLSESEIMQMPLRESEALAKSWWLNDFSTQQESLN